MSYLSIDDRAYTHPKLLAVSDKAFRLWFSGISYCQQHLTNGVVPNGAIETLPGFSRATLLELMKAHAPGRHALWRRREDDGAVEIHDYLDWNQSREEVLKRRDGKAERMRKWRERKVGPPDTPQGEPQGGPRDAPRDGAHIHNPIHTVAKATGAPAAAPLVGRRNTRVLNDGDPVQFPSSLSDEFQAVIRPRLAPGVDPYTALLEWIHRVSDELVETHGGAPQEFINDAFKAWRGRLARDWGIARTSAGAKVCRHRHSPPCADDAACTEKYLSEMRSGTGPS